MYQSYKQVGSPKISKFRRYAASALEALGHGSAAVSTAAVEPISGAVSVGAFAMANALRHGIKRLQEHESKTLDKSTKSIIMEINYTLEYLPDDILDHKYSAKIKSACHHIGGLINELNEEIGKITSSRPTPDRESLFKKRVRDIGLEISLSVGHINLLHNAR
jgi:hypothetical protein